MCGHCMGRGPSVHAAQGGGLTCVFGGVLLVHKEGSQSTGVLRGELYVQCTGKVLGMFALHEEALDECALHEGHSWGSVFHEEGSQHVPGCTCPCQRAREGLCPITVT